MTDILKLVGLGVASALLAVVLRKDRPEMAMLVSLVAGVCLFMPAIERVREVVGTLTSLAKRAELEGGVLSLLIRIIGIAALCEMGAQLCRDAGESGIASRIEMGGKLMVLALSMPIAVSLVDRVLRMMP